jgi:hypothetical protein
MTTYKRTATVDQLLNRVIRILNGYMEGEEPSVEQMENARFVFNGYIDSLDESGSRFFLRADRQYVFPETSIVLESGNRYRCIKSFTAPNITTHATSTSYSEGANVYPTVYNGYRYEAQNDGTSAGSVPTFPVIQGNTVTDNDIVWKTIPDEKPSVGANWRTYFKLDSSATGGSAYASGEYVRAGDFDLQDDEVLIESAFVRKNGVDTQLTIVSDIDFSEVSDKTTESEPTHLYLENIGLNTKAHLYPGPSSVGVDGYVLHYKARLRAQNYEGSTTLNMPDSWFTAVIYNVADRLADEYQLPAADRVIIAQRAEKYEKGSRTLDMPKISTGASVIVSTY